VDLKAGVNGTGKERIPVLAGNRILFFWPMTSQFNDCKQRERTKEENTEGEENESKKEILVG
jgi:hypothetical protein